MIKVRIGRKPYIVKRLLGSGDSNAKTAKNGKSGEVLTVGLSLAASNLSGYNTCQHATAGCRASCLVFTGHARAKRRNQKHSPTNLARIARTIAFFEHMDAFLSMLLRELRNAQKRADRQGKTLAVRLNMFSDLPWETLFPQIFSNFPRAQFYDYTKSPIRARRYAQGRFPANYHITFSRSESNETETLAALAQGLSVAVVFDLGNARKPENRLPLPTTWQGYPVVSGDETDLRYLDDKRTVIGLYAKHSAGRQVGVDSGFFVSPQNACVPVSQGCQPASLMNTGR